jgi:hypothetical protein
LTELKPILGKILGMFLLEVVQKTPIVSREARKDVQRRQYRSNSSKNRQKVAFLA